MNGKYSFKDDYDQHSPDTTDNDYALYFLA